MRNLLLHQVLATAAGDQVSDSQVQVWHSLRVLQRGKRVIPCETSDGSNPIVFLRDGRNRPQRIGIHGIGIFRRAT